MKLLTCNMNDQKNIAPMICELMNYHRKLTNAPKEFWQSLETSEKTFAEWLATGEVKKIDHKDETIGFIYLRLGGQSVAWLEDLYIDEKYQGQGLGKKVMNMLDEQLKDRGVISMFVDVIPRNPGAIKFYQECGFDHLNMIQLRKNYQKRLDKEETTDLLGFTFKKY
ncbi:MULTISPECIES: GNAT family N-acetyltransferase [unclassified Fusibacter]|uniref:GNAT family N-acetyltransferase n=1 Tax=unclassified Fusibacter TaxID=2624464 RepID=UPI001011717A|nr:MULTISPECIES: GNAT family N-acetyltransferase [unclassified Fusibacter]MCK8058161.1 GNAT family N-acetyltransferase [Fusibacter sp. A2]NPE20744.1 GNAT family N-acetyltransferase [Fusibacter sp. A1]RXV62951.1 GNAT family N-acetyltransferase [Fusibacter sp. A1]